MNLTTYLNSVGNKINGKALRKPDLNLVAKLDVMNTYLAPDDWATEGLIPATNPITGYTAMLNPFIAALINWTFKTYSTYDFTGRMSYKGTKVAIGTYDRVRYLVLALDANAYSNFLD